MATLIRIINDTRARYGELVNKKFEHGLTEEEQREVDQLSKILDCIEEEYYERIKQNIERMFTNATVASGDNDRTGRVTASRPRQSSQAKRRCKSR